MMQIFYSSPLSFLMSVLLSSSLLGQHAPVIIEAESGTLGSDYSIETEGPHTYVSITTNGVADTPENADRTISFEVTFPAAQEYDLYLRCRVGSGGADDDSFFYGAGFGEQPFTGDRWVRVNNILNSGYNLADQYVDGGGIVGTGLWKWINLSEYTEDETPLTFSVDEGALTQTFQIGAREDGLDIDKIAFGRSDYFFTVANLNEGTEGSPNIDLLDPIAEGKPKFLGNIYSGSQTTEFEQYWNQVTPENAGKWGSVERTRDQMNWTQLDAAYNLARDNGFLFKLHVLIWGNQQPTWMENLSSSEQREEIEEWFAAVAERYPDIDVIEVVNEPLHDPPRGAGNGNYIEALGGNGSTGWDWIIESFTLAREHFPNAQLMLNDYNIVNSVSSTRDYKEIVELLQERGLIDQIGVQAHAFSTRGSMATVTTNLNTLAETGLPLFATELDIDGLTDQEQLEDYMRIFPTFWEHPAVQGVTLWGWRPGLWRNEEMAYIMNSNNTERPALIWLRNYVMGMVNTTEIAPTEHITLSPNPLRAGEQLKVSGLEQFDSYQLFDLSGRMLYQAKATGPMFILPLELTSGMYFLSLTDGKKVYVKQLVVE